LLGAERHSARPGAAAFAVEDALTHPSNMTNVAKAIREGRTVPPENLAREEALLIPQGLDRIQFGGARRGINARGQAYHN
jgi:hypothetical protein